MLKLIFFINREVFEILIDGKEVFYKDRKWGLKKLLPLNPEQEKDLKKLGLGTEGLFDEGGKEMYEKANSEEELAQMIIKDCQKRGARLIMKREEE